MDGKKIGIILVIIIAIVGFFMFNNYQQDQLAKEQTAKQDQIDKTEALAKVKSQQAENDRLKAKKQELEQEQEAQELKANEDEQKELDKLMTFKNSKHIFYFKSNEIVIIDTQATKDFFLGLDSLSKASLVQKVVIDAYTDDVDSDSYNMKLSNKRAEVFDAQLKPYELNIELNAKGETNPIASNDTKEGRGLNRRIEVTLY